MISQLAQRARVILVSGGSPQGVLAALEEIERLGVIADRRVAQVEEIASLVSRPHCEFTPDEVVGAVKGLLSDVRRSHE